MVAFQEMFSVVSILELHITSMVVGKIFSAVSLLFPFIILIINRNNLFFIPNFSKTSIIYLFAFRVVKTNLIS